MVAKIIISKSIEKALNYNEQKLQNGKADCIFAGNFLKDADRMNFYEKLHRFQHQISLNTRATTNTLHISLNFDPSENLEKQELIKIASTYMQGIGFGEQPFLIYQHYDAGHPHVHIVTTNIQEDGRRINTHNIGEKQSEKARKAIEIQFGLVKAAGRNRRNADYGTEPGKLKKVEYGKSETKRAITNVVDAVVKSYKYASLAELNAVLRLYNVMADRGKVDGRIYQNGGLVYRVLDEQGSKVGVPIKASSIHSKPTLATLEKMFKENVSKKSSYRLPLMDKIESALTRSNTLQDLLRELRKSGIDTLLRKNDEGRMYGITFIDHNSKSVFNGSDVGKSYSAAAIQKHFSIQNATAEKVIADDPKAEKHFSNELAKDLQQPKSYDISSLFDDLLHIEKDNGFVPYGLKKKRKRRKRKPGQ